MKPILIFIVILIHWQTLIAETHVPIPSQTNIIACSMMDGRLTHNIFKSEDNFNALIMFPIYLKNPTKEILEEKKIEWAQWDGTAENRPSDPRTVAIGVPIENTNLISFDINRLIAKSEFFAKIFPEIEKTDFIDFNTGKLFINFGKNACRIIKKENLTSVYCQNQDPTIIKGLKIDQITLLMVQEKSSRIIQDTGNAANFLVKTQNNVQAHLTFLTEGRYYRSSFTHSPNGDDEQCLIDGKKLSQYDN